jgi:hypothetical protein
MPNLHEFLLELRDTHTTQILWADAVCINQKDNDERSHQLIVMARIYSSAEEVMAWLGPAADQSDEVIDLVALFPSGVREPVGCDFGQNNFFRALCDRRISLPFC